MLSSGTSLPGAKKAPGIRKPNEAKTVVLLASSVKVSELKYVLLKSTSYPRPRCASVGYRRGIAYACS